MTWQLSSFAIVLGSLAVAFWWYERSHPPAKLLAVIATLAALAALGRDAFAAVPDVKPITTIVLVSGLAFGIRPGFAIGAISALASNILLGQGPWTPWQMLGWGLVGVFGALLRRPLGEQPSPLALGLACAAGAELFNLFLNVYTWTGTGNHTLAAYGVVLGSALAFDLTHVGASFAFGFAFGPALLRMLARVRARLEVRWSAAAAPAAPRRPHPTRLLGGPPAALLLVLCVPLALGLTACANASKSAAADPPAEQARLAISRELAYLKAAQNADGGFGARRAARAASCTRPGRRSGWRPPGAARWRCGATGTRSSTRCAAKRRACTARATSSARSSRFAPAARPATRFPAAIRSSDCSHRAPPTARSRISRTSPRSRILALRAAGYAPKAAPVISAAGWLVRQQEADGGFGFGVQGAGSDIDDTAAAIQALGGTGARAGSAVRRGRRLPAPRAEPRRRLPAAARRALERAVDVLGDPGAHSGRHRRRRRQAPGQPQPAGLSADAARAPTAACATRALAPRHRCG